MKYYKTWQEALVDFTKTYGHLHKDSYNLLIEFESNLFQNKNGSFYMNKEK